MSKKELWQVGWAGGQTEGDLTKQTVKEILNSEINILGTLTPRGEVINQSAEDETVANVIDLKFMTNPVDPSETLSVYLTTTHLRIRGSATTEDIALGVTLDSDSEMLIVEGTTIYIAAIVSGDPYGVFSISYTGSGDRFRPPENMDNHSGEGEISDPGDEWILNTPAGITPDLVHVEMSSTYISDTDTSLQTNSERRVVIGTYVNRSYSIEGRDDFPITDSMGIEVAVQFEMHDGQLSPLSDSATFSYTREATDADRTLSIAIGLAISSSISKRVRRIHVYRRVRELDGQNYGDTNPLGLLYSADVMSEDLADAVIVSAESSIGKVDMEVDTSAPWGKTQLGQDPAATSEIVMHTSVNVYVEGATTINESAGWLEYSTDTMFYWPQAITYDGELHIELLDWNNWTTVYYKLKMENSQGVFTYPSLSGSYVSVFLDAHVKDGTTYAPYVTITHSTDVFYPLQDMTGITNDYVAGYGPDIAPYVINNIATPVATVNNGGTDQSQNVTGVSNVEALLCFVDVGDARLVNVDDLVGFTQQEASDVKPRHIATSSGRMLMLNVIQDDEYKVSRLCYSEFRKYTAVAKSNYVDYEARDDGIGVGIAEFKGRVLVLHSTSVYIMDISGGAGMSWRELGAYNEINALGRPAIVETPFGVFFGGQDFAYLFDGNRVNNISETPERRISAAYRKMVSRGTPSFAWRSDLRQLWIISLADDDETTRRFDALVYDADLGSWHYHLFDELTSTTALPLDFMAISNQGGAEYIFTNENDATIKKYSIDDTTLVRPFSWGVNTGQINMGSSEFQKKLKRIYIDTEGKVDDDGNGTYGKLYITVDGFTQDFEPDTARHVTRISSSNKNYYLDFSIYAESAGGESWTGTIESLGLSYKPKKLK